MSFLTKATLAIVAGATTLTVAAPAEAQRWHRYRNNNDGAVIAAGVAGLAIGALAAGAGRDRYYNRGGYYDRGYYPRRGYYAPRYRGYYAPPPRFRGYDRFERRAIRRAYRDRYYGW